MLAKAPEIRLLGVPAVFHDGERRHVSRRKSLALIAYLALHDNRQPRDSLTALLWPEFAPEQSRGALRTTLVHVRELLPDGAVGSDREQVWLNAESTVVDAVRYLELCDSFDAATNRAAELPTDSVALLEKAARLYRGEFLAGFFLSGCPDFDTWQLATADRFAHLQTELLWDLVRHHADTGDTQAAMRLIGEMLEMDPGNEEAHRELMLLFFESGDRGSAIRQYERCSRVLEAELGSAPDESTRDLYETIRHARIESPRGARQPAPRTGEQEDLLHGDRVPVAKSLVGEVRVVSLLVVGVNAAGGEFGRDDGSLEEDGPARPDDELDESLLSAVAEEAAGFDGTTVHTEGRGALVAFGLERTHEDDPERAVLSALHIRDQLAANGRRAALAVRTGAMVVRERSEELVGPLVSLAHRQHSRTRAGTITVCEQTNHRVRYHVHCVDEPEGRGVDQRLGRLHKIIAWLDVASPLEDTAVPFVGRKRELGQLAAGLMDNQIAGAIISGPAGMGKSRLVAECQKELARRGVPLQWLAVLCAERHQGSAFRSMVPLVQALLHILVPPGEVGSPVNAVCRLLTESNTITEKEGGEARTVLSSLLPGGIVGDVSGASALITREDFRRALLTTIRGLLALVREHSPVIVQIEDIHWGDEAMVSLLTDLLPDVAGPDIRFLVTCRPEEVTREQPVLKRMERLGRGRILEIELEPLADRAIRSIVSHGRPGPHDEQEVMAVVSRAGGNPFYALELSRGSGARPGAAMELPLALDVRRVIQRRTDKLAPEMRSLLHTAAVTGNEADWVVLCEAAGIAAEQRGHCLDQLSADRILIRQSHPGRLRVAFAHDLFRQALYDSLSVEDRCGLHLRVGRALERQFSGELSAQTADLAHHYDAAEEHEAAARWLIEHGDHLHTLFDYSGAIAAYTQAVDHLAHFANVRALRECWLKIASCYEQELDHDSSRRALERVFALPCERSRPPSPGLRQQRGEGYASIATPDTAFGLDPLRSLNPASFILHRQVYRPLVRYMPRGLIEPDAAARWDTSDDGLSYRFVIRDDAVWSDGAPLVAEDFALAFTRAIELLGDAETGAYIRVRGTPEFRKSGDRRALAIHCPEPKVLEFELEAPCPYLLHYLGVPYLQGIPSHLIRRWGDAWTDVDKVAASGPFVIESLDARTAVHLVRNPLFTGRFTGNVTDVVLTRCSNAEVLDRYEKGIVDAFVVREDKLLGDVLQRCPEDVLSGPGQMVCLLRVNPCSRVLKSRPARQALACAIDRESLLRSSGFQSAAPGTGGVIPPGVRGHRPDIGLPFDPARAKALARQGKLRTGTRLCLCAAGWADRLVHDVAQSWFDHLGVEVRLLGPDEEVFDRPPSEWPFDVALVFLMGLVPDPLVYLADSEPYLNEHMRRLFTAARSESDPRERLQRVYQLDAASVENAARIPLYYPRGHRVARPWLKQAVYFPLYHGGLVDVTVLPH